MRLFALIWLVLGSGVAGAAQDEALADNIVVVLDASGSMEERMPGSRDSKMEVAKRAINRVVGGLPPETRLGVLVFSGTGKRADWAVPLGPLDPDAVANAIRPIGPDGRTPLGAYMQKGTEALLAQRDTQSGYGTFRMLVVTDGEANDPDVVESATPIILARGITVDVIGVDMASAHTLATRVHSYRRADREEELETALAEVFAEIGSDPDSVTPEEAYEEIGPLPDGAAGAILTALSSVRAGGMPGAPTSGDAPPRRDTGSSTQQPTPPTGGSGHAQPSSSTGSGGSALMLIPCVGMLVVALAIGLIVIAIAKKAFG